MAADGVLARLCIILYLVLLYSSFKYREYDIVPATTRFYMGTCLTAPPVFEERTSKATRPDLAVRRYPPCSILKTSIEVCKRSGMAICLLYLAGDLETNPGPSLKKICGICTKTIRKNQPFCDCSVCQRPILFKCFGPDFDYIKSCRNCSTPSDSECESNAEDCKVTLPQKLRDIPGVNGFKIVHQNIRSLNCKIDELRFMVAELNSGLQLLTLSETWTYEELTDSELVITGYQIFRRDRPQGIRGGVAVYARNNLKLLGRHDQESKDFALNFFRQSLIAF